MARFPDQKGAPPWTYAKQIPTRTYTVKKRPVRYRKRRPLTYKKLYGMLLNLPQYRSYPYVIDYFTGQFDKNIDELDIDYYWAVMCLDTLTAKVPRHVLMYWYGYMQYIRKAPDTQIPTLKGTWDYMRNMHIIASAEWAIEKAEMIFSIAKKIAGLLESVFEVGLKEAAKETLYEYVKKQIEEAPEQVLEDWEEELKKELVRRK